MKKSKLLKLAAGAVVVAGLVGVGSPAFADQGSAVIGASAYYKTSGMKLTATDTDSDGKSAIAEIRFNGSVIARATESRGKGYTSPAKTVPVQAGRSIDIRACVQDLGNNGPKTCAPWKNTTS